MEHRRQRLQCSFCGHSQERVQHLIAGPRGVFICGECVALCNRILADSPPPGPAPSRQPPRLGAGRGRGPSWQRFLPRGYRVSRVESHC